MKQSILSPAKTAITGKIKVFVFLLIAIFFININKSFSQTTVPFAYTGAVQMWTVPAGVTSITVDAYGAQGGWGGNATLWNPGGLGGEIEATIAVTPGQILDIYVGGVGGNETNVAGGTAGYNGGGTGGDQSSWLGGGGGGASDVRVTPYALGNIIIVAGAGGGGGDNTNTAAQENGGLGGGLIGGAGWMDGILNEDIQWCGQGGTQVVGGAAGNSTQCTCTASALGLGGSSDPAESGGGGGGGYWGGGSGCHGGGGGGSSWTSGTILINNQGVQSGNGQVIITYTAVLGPPTISSFTPTTGCPGTSVTITGTGFTGALAVTFGLTPATSFTVVSDVEITAVVGAGTSGTIAVTTPLGTATSVGTFTIGLPAAPSPATANGSNPLSICAGASVSLNATSAGNSINWYTVSTGGTPIGTVASGADYVVAPVVATTYYAETETGGASGSQTFNYISNATQSWTVPSGVTSVTVQLWGAGGGSGYMPTAYEMCGGSGAYMSGTLTGLTTGQVLTLYVPQGGQYSSSGVGGAGGWPGGGQGGNDASWNEYGGGGGGYAAIQIAGNYYAVAGAGGGGGSSYYGGDAHGGEGGATTGGTGGIAGGTTGGGGGTIAAGGAAGTVLTTATAGSYLTGGIGDITSGMYGGGGGGAGYYGGGGGNEYGSGAGGGSSYPAATFTSGGITFTLTSNLAGTTYLGTTIGGTALAQGSPSPASIGEGILEGAGGNGQVIITWTGGSGCVSSTRTPVVVNIGGPAAPSPATANGSNPLTICPGTSVSLNATSVGNTINWYTVSTGGTVLANVASGANYVVVPAGAITYYAETQTGGLPGSQTFTYTGGSQTFTIPSGVTSITVDAQGAAGGGVNAYSTYQSVGGAGGRVQATMTVNPGDVLNINVGGQGDYLDGNGGYNGGGSDAAYTAMWPGAGGGGGTSIIDNTTATTLVWAGGGGGGGGDIARNDVGGAGGGLTGGTGNSNICGVGLGGAGGSQIAGGAGAVCTYTGGTGSQPTGGASGPTEGSGGGGGGWWGGGGGAYGGGGGGGSSYTNPTFVTAVTHTQGYNSSGNGQAILSWSGASLCVSTTRTPVVINLPSAPTPVTANGSNPLTICSGSSVSLNATSAGNTINWYTVSTGGTILTNVASGTNYVVAPATTTTYYAETQVTGASGGSYTFTNCSATGMLGPTQAQVTSAYASTTLAGLVTVPVQGIQQWTVPATGNYTFQVNGASGGTTLYAGYGAQVNGTLALTAGNILDFIVGQMGSSYAITYSDGGGGGSFVASGAIYSTATPLLVAGGGGGGAQGTTVGQNASTTTSVVNGAASEFGSVGAGFSTNGVAGTYPMTWPTVAQSFTNGGNGQAGGTAGGWPGTGYGDGGYGGGGSSCSCSQGGGGGGGGYAGGGGGIYTSIYPSGYGGSSYIDGTATGTSSSVLSSFGNGVINVSFVGSVGCTSTTRTPVVVNVSAQPTATAGGTQTICPNGTAIVSGATATNGTILWTSNGSGTITNATTLTPTYNAVPADAGNTVTLTMTVTNSPCPAATATYTVIVSTLPVATAGNNGPVCIGATLSLNSTPAGMTYSWSGPLGFTSALQNPVVSASATAGMAGTYTVTVTNVSGCIGTASTTVSISPSLTVTANSNSPVCVGSPLSLSSLPAGMTTYSWSGPLAYTSAVQSPVVSASATTGMAGIYTVTITNSGGCSGSASTTIVVNALPVTTAGNNGPVCLGTTLSLTSTPAGMTTYSWSGPLAYTSAVQNPVVSASVTAGMAGIYTVTVTNVSGCIGTASTTVTISPDLTVTASSNTPVCVGSPLSLSSLPAGMTNYSWSGPLAYTSAVQNPVVSASATAGMAGTYTVTVTNASGCIGTANTIVVVNPLPVATASNNGPICTGATLSLTGGPAGMTTYSWSGPLAYTSALQSPVVSASATAGMAGTYTITVTNSNGCSSTASTTVIISPSLTVTASSNTPVCVGSPLSLSSLPAGMTTYSWTGPLAYTSAVQSPVVSASATTAMAGIYTVTVTNSGGCSGSASTTVVVNPSPTVFNLSGSVSGSAGYCSGGTGVPIGLTGSQIGVTYQLQLNSFNTGLPIAGTGGIITFGNQTAVGVYTVIGTMTSDGCSVSMGNSITVFIYALPVPTAANNGPVCVGSPLNLTGAPGGMITYAWSGPLAYTSAVRNPVVSASATTAMAGTYIITVTDANGCSNTAQTVVLVNTIPVAIASSNSPVCVGQTLNLTSSGGSSYSWSGPSSFSSALQNPSIAGVTLAAAGTYTVTVTAAGGCSATAQATVVVNTNPIATAFSNSPVCVGASLNLTGGPAGMSHYAWSGPLAYTSTLQSPVVSANATAGMAGVYTITVTNASNCTSTASTTVVVNALPIATASSNSPVCAGSTLSLTGGPAGMSTYSWSGPLGYTSALQSPVVSASATIAMSGTYTLTVTNGTGCIGTASTTVTVNSSLTATAGNNGPVCAGSALSLTGGPAGMSNYSWSGPLGFTSILQSPVVSANATVGMAGIYTLTVTNGSGCVGTASTTVVVNPLPTAYSVTGGGSFCSGGTGVLVCLSGSDIGVSYQLQLSSVNIGSPVAGTGAVICFGLQTSAGPYTVIATNATSLCQNTMTGSVTVTVNPSPVANAGSPVSIPTGTFTTLNGSATGGTPGYTYSWSPAGSLVNPNIQNPTTVSLTSTTTYTLTVIDANGCSGTSQVIVTISGAALSAAASTTHSSICAGSPDQVLCNATGGSGIYSYSWSSVPAGFTSSLQNPGISPSATTTYTVTVNDGYNTASSSVMVTVFPLPSASAGLSVNICNGSNTTLDASGGISYSWSPGTGLSATNIFNPVANPATSMSYDVTVTDANSCSATAGVNVTVFSVVPANAGVDQTICNGQSAYLNAFGGIAFSWSPAGSLSSSTVSNPVATPTATTTYTVVTGDANGCTSSDNVTVNVNPSVIASAGSSVSICQGNSTTLSASGGTIFAWSPSYGLSNPSIANPVASPLYSTNYIVTVSNSGGCSATAGVTVTVNTAPIATVGPNVTMCFGSSTNLSASGGTSYSWSPNINLSASNISNPIASPTSSVTYTVVVSNASGCSASANVTVTVNPLPAASAGTSPTICNFSSVVLTATGGVFYQWSNGVNTAVNPVSPSVTSSYTVTVTDINNCSATSNVTVTVLPYNPPVISAGGPVTFCNSAAINVALDAGAGYSIYNWSNGMTTQVINVTTPGSYYVIGYYADGCYDTSAIVNVASYPAYPPPVIAANGSTDFCEGDTISVNLTTTVNYYTYSWSSGSTTPIIHVNHADYYWVTVTDTNGCASVSDTVHVEFIPKPTAYMNYIQSGIHVTFVDNSLNGTTYLWRFGDGNTSTLENPSHNYPALGTYLVTFIVSNTCGSDSVMVKITLVSGNGINELGIVQNLEVYPIPTKDLLFVSFEFTGSKEIELKIVNTLGQLLYKDVSDDYTGKYHKVLDLSVYPKGIYYLRIQSDKGIVNRKIIVN